MKTIELETAEKLSDKALAEALKRMETDPHDGWADLTVHQAQLRPALKLANAHNLTKPAIKLRVLCETRIEREGWRLVTRSVRLEVHRA